MSFPINFFIRNMDFSVLFKPPLLIGLSPLTYESCDISYNQFININTYHIIWIYSFIKKIQHTCNLSELFAINIVTGSEYIASWAAVCKQ